MAAGLGYKEFTTGDVLTAADANGYLASQVVMVFASSAARTSAITSPQEGMISYLKDTNSTEYYSGSAWVAIGGSGSKVVKVVNTQTGAVATGTTTIPFDDTIPQNTEGTQFMTATITPASASNILKIDVVAFVAPNAQVTMQGALFQDSTANALAASVQVVSTSTDRVQLDAFSHYMVAGTTSATTFKYRSGANAAATVTFNGRAGTRLMGGVMASSITITEYTP